MEGADESKRAAAVARLIQLREAEQLSAAHVRLAAEGLGVSERTVWRWLSEPARVPEHRGPEPYVLSETDREAYALYRGNVSAVHRARQAVVDGDGTTAGAPVPDFLREGWAGAAPEFDPSRPVTKNEPCIRAHVPLQQNTDAGAKYSGFISSQHVIDGEKFTANLHF